jgi:hypothetical protein
MDSNTFGVLTTLGIDTLIALIILIGWLLIRKIRGDKQTLSRDSDRTGSLAFDEESVDYSKKLSQLPRASLLDEDDMRVPRTSNDFEKIWRVSAEVPLIDENMFSKSEDGKDMHSPTEAAGAKLNVVKEVSEDREYSRGNVSGAMPPN